MDLSEKTLDETLLHAQQTFTGELKVSIVDSKAEWDTTLLRNVFEQSMVIKRALHEFEVITNEFGLLAGFIDHAQWEDCKYQDVSVSQLLSIAMESGWLGSTCKVESNCLRGSNNEASIDIGFTDHDKKLHAGINTTTNKLIYLLPKEVNPYE